MGESGPELRATLTTGALPRGTKLPGKKYASIKYPRVYEALKAKGMSKEKAARISNAMAAKRKKGK